MNLLCNHLSLPMPHARTICPLCKPHLCLLTIVRLTRICGQMFWFIYEHESLTAKVERLGACNPFGHL